MLRQNLPQPGPAARAVPIIPVVGTQKNLCLMRVLGHCHSRHVNGKGERGHAGFFRRQTHQGPACSWLGVKMRSKTLPYRPDIDGLRAIAVLSVVFYHYRVPGFPGGFIGVDIFFVISGYLITRLVYQQARAGTFSFRDFYLRRIRRLFPALALTLLLTLLGAALVLPPEQLARLGRIAGAAVLSLSNLMFWREAGYFDGAAQTKPLLHTWSLGVEEQFYLVWPALILLCSRHLNRRSMAGLMAGLVVLGVLITGGLGGAHAAATFYLTPFRLPEFALGALMVFLDPSRPRKAVIVTPLFLLGLALMSVPVFVYTDKMVFPGFAAIWPCLGAGLLIFTGPNTRLNILLANRAMVGIGLISYSLYLIHWPLFVLAHQSLGPLSGLMRVALIGLSVLLAALSYRFVETPFRQKWQKPRLYKLLGRPGGYVGMAVLVLCLSASAALGGGWKGRYNAALKTLLDTKEDYRTTNRLGSCYQLKTAHWQDIPRACYDPSLLPDNDRPDILLVGSSYSADLYPGLSKVLVNADLLQLSKAGCLFRNVHLDKNIPACNAYNRFVFDQVLPNHHYDLVIISTGGTPGKAWEKTRAVFDALGQDYVVMGDRPKFTEDPKILVSRHGRRAGPRAVLEAVLSRAARFPDDQAWRAALPPDKFFSLTEALCPTPQTCQWIVQGHLVYRDKNHFNTDGAVLIAKAFSTWLSQNRPGLVKTP